MIDTNEYIRKHNYFVTLTRDQISAEKDAIDRLLVNFGVHVTRIVESARMIQYRATLSPETNVQKILRMEENFCIALNDDSVNIYRDKAELVIEKAGADNAIFMGDLVNDKFDKMNGLTIALGKDMENVNCYTNLAKAPHVLIAGTTGSGKSILLHAFICSLLIKNPFTEIYTVDTKQTEFNEYGRIPNVHNVTDANDAVQMLMRLCNEMERRYKVLTDAQCRDIDEYRESGKTMERIVVVVDELADLMLLSGKTVEQYIVRLAQKARACGIHLVLATQRPTVNVVTGLIKANIPTRVCLKVTSSLDSRIILDRNGGEKLIGHGDMLFLGNGAYEPIRMQGIYLQMDEIKNIVGLSRQYIRTHNVNG